MRQVKKDDGCGDMRGFIKRPNYHTALARLPRSNHISDFAVPDRSAGCPGILEEMAAANHERQSLILINAADCKRLPYQADRRFRGLFSGRVMMTVKRQLELPTAEGSGIHRSLSGCALSLLSIAFAMLLHSTPAPAVTLDDFQVHTAKQLADLCRATPQDSDSIAAVQFCQGFITGAYHYHVASLSGPAGKPVICFNGNQPSRGAAAAEFVAWLDAHPQYMNEDAVEAQFKWLTETWPCKN